MVEAIIHKRTKEKNSSPELLRKFDVVMLDAMNTIFVTENGVLSLYRELFALNGLRIGMSEVEKPYREVRALFEKKRGVLPWGEINAEIIHRLFPDIKKEKTLSMGKMISKEFYSNPERYEVRGEMRQFLGYLRGKTKVIIASNQDQSSLEKFVKHFGIGDLLVDIFSSDRVGYRKPDPNFFTEITKIIGLNPEKFLMVGNGAKKDVEGARLAGIKGVLLDWRNELNNEDVRHRITDPNQLLTMHFS